MKTKSTEEKGEFLTSHNDTEFTVRIGVGKLFHRNGAAKEKLSSAADWSAFLQNFGTERHVLSCAEQGPVHVW